MTIVEPVKGRRSAATVIAVIGLVAAAATSLLIALAVGGGADAPAILDPGVAVRFGLPIAKLLVNVGAAVSLGSLVIVCFALRPQSPEFSRALDAASVGAAIWTIGSIATGLFLFLTVFNEPLSLSPQFGSTLQYFATGTELGQAWLITAIAAAILTTACLVVRNTTILGVVLVGAAAALIPMSTQGHQGGTADHDAATTALYLHILFAAIWLGGMLVVIIVRRLMDAASFGSLLRVFSFVALICFMVVGGSGLISSAIRLDGWASLLTPYGTLVITKAVVLVGLGALGAAWRRFAIRRAYESRKWFWLLASAELILMGIASGVGAALARTPTPPSPYSPSIPTSAEILTGAPLPPAPTPLSLVTMWNVDPVWILLCIAALFFYLAGVLRLKRRGDHWPVHRTVLWVAGIAALFLITNGGVNLYQKYLFSSHMLSHMALGMIVPILLVPAAPVTLALRTIRKRHDGSRGVREWLMLVTHSRLFGALTNPLVAASLFVGSLWLFYYTPLFNWAVSNHLGHQWMVAHFLITGYLFVQSLIGVDPSPHRFPYPFRLIVLLATMAMHAFFGLALVSSTTLLLPDWYGAMDWPTIDPLTDQQAAGGIAWSVGEIPSLVLAITIVGMWSRSDRREADRFDRQANRDGDAELTRYNQMLAARAARRPPRP